MDRRTRALIAAGLLMCMSGSAIGSEVADPCFKDLPVGCSIARSTIVSKQQADAIGKKLGVPLIKLSNTWLHVQGKSVQVNILETRTGEQAEQLHKKIAAMKTDPAFCLRRGSKVIEFCNAEASTAIKTAYELGLSEKPAQIRYRIIAYLATIDRSHDMASNELFNVLLRTNIRDPSDKSLRAIRALTKNFEFGDQLLLREVLAGRNTYALTPKPIKTSSASKGQIAYSFEKLPTVFDIPYVTLKAEAICSRGGWTPTDRKADKLLLAATAYWPVDDLQIRKLAGKITAGKRTQQEKVQAILEWLQPGRHIRSAGPTGSRWGVKQVLKQKYGHCWDFADCFVTLARAAGIPSRQVGGWLYGSSGHIWAEVLIDGEAWQQVDATGGGKLNCGIYHIPYFTTETGEMPILYLAMPKIEIVETRQDIAHPSWRP